MISPSEAVAAPEAVVLAGNARFTVLTPTLLRIEYAPNGCFEDRPTLFAVRRRLPVPHFEARFEEQRLDIKTDALTLRYESGSGRFHRVNLSIRLAGPSAVEWRPGMQNKKNLGGTVHTLDECKGPVDLGEGIISRDGWYLLDDSLRPVFADGWVGPRPEPARQDWYFFGFGRDYARGLQDLVAVAGNIPLAPRFAFGSWYSRYWPYRSGEFLTVADEYRRHGFPLDVMVLDMDWHLKGWTGYTWNRELIPDPEGLLQDLHERGLKVTLNLHPADGVQPHEEAYAVFARAMDIDPNSKTGVEFDCTSEKYMRSYFDILHHPLEAQGVDFWWLDWQQSVKTSVEGVDPLFWLNHLHFHDRQRPAGAGPATRGLLLSRWGGLGGHRYPIHFSGDTWATWEVLRFLVHFTATAGNIGAAYWSHDLGGHHAVGRTDPELFVRWVQFGAFTTAMRVHTTLSADNDRRPWLDGSPFTEAARAAYALRYRLLPYIYAMARNCYDTGLPLNRPMYLTYPSEDAAYRVPHQFLFGDDLIVAPALEPGQGQSRIVDVQVWLPDGVWYELTTNVRYQGPAWHVVPAPLDRVPVFVRAGRPIPLAPPGRLHSGEALDVLHLLVYPGADGQTRLYEDDGETVAYLNGEYAWTPLHYETSGADLRIRLGPSIGVYRDMPQLRQVVIELPGTPPPKRIHGRGVTPDQQTWDYEPATRTTTVHLSDVISSRPAEVVVELASSE